MSRLWRADQPIPQDFLDEIERAWSSGEEPDESEGEEERQWQAERSAYAKLTNQRRREAEKRNMAFEEVDWTNSRRKRTGPPSVGTTSDAECSDSEDHQPAVPKVVRDVVAHHSGRVFASDTAAPSLASSSTVCTIPVGVENIQSAPLSAAEIEAMEVVFDTEYPLPSSFSPSQARVASEVFSTYEEEDGSRVLGEAALNMDEASPEAPLYSPLTPRMPTPPQRRPVARRRGAGRGRAVARGRVVARNRTVARGRPESRRRVAGRGSGIARGRARGSSSTRRVWDTSMPYTRVLDGVAEPAREGRSRSPLRPARPSYRAARAARASPGVESDSGEDEVMLEYVEDDTGAGDEALFPGDRDARNFEWRDIDSFEGTREEFTGGDPGSVKRYATPYDAFRAIMDDEIMEHIARETNRYAADKVAARADSEANTQSNAEADADVDAEADVDVDAEADANLNAEVDARSTPSATRKHQVRWRPTNANEIPQHFNSH